MSVDVLLLSLGTTRGWRVADELFLAQLERAGASTAAVGVRFGGAGPAASRLSGQRPRRDARGAARATQPALRAHRPRALVVSTTTAAMLLPPLDIPYAVRLDAPAALNRPGARNALLRALERRALQRARLVLPWSEAGAGGAALRRRAGADPAAAGRAVAHAPTALPRHRAPTRRRPVSYVPDPKAKGLELVVRRLGGGGRRGRPAGDLRHRSRPGRAAT